MKLSTKKCSAFYIPGVSFLNMDLKISIIFTSNKTAF